MKIRYLIAALFVISVSCQPEGDIKIKDEIRGVHISIIDNPEFQTQRDIAQSVDSLAEAGFNIVFPEVIKNGCAVFPSEVELLSSYQNNTCRFSENEQNELLQPLIIEVVC